MSFASLSLDALQVFRAAIDAEIASRPSVKAESVKPAKAEAKVPAKAEAKAPREPGIAASWLSHVIKEHASDYASYKESSQDKRGVALLFAKQWRAQHAEEYTLFEANFKKVAVAVAVAAPAPVAAPVAAAPAQAEAPSPQPPQPVEKKARKPWSAEAKAAAAAKRAAKKEAAPTQ